MIHSQGRYTAHENDMTIIRKHFEDNDATDIKVHEKETIFNIMWYFQLRGRENLRCLTKDTFGFSSYGNGHEYCFK